MSVREIRLEAADVLAAAGVDSPGVDATLLLAHVVGRTAGELVMVDGLTDDQLSRFRELVRRRATREPLQHIIGRVQFGSVELEVGPGVFTPRMETELLWSWGCKVLAAVPDPVVVDLCSGSGALALSLADSVTGSLVHAVEIDPDALTWLRRNLSHLPQPVRDRVVVHSGDVRDPDVLAGVSADLIVANPPYIPTGTDLPAEVAEYDPALALFGGVDGMSVITPMIETIARVLRPGGAVAIEHDDTTGGLVMAALDTSADFEGISQMEDLAGRARFVSARRARMNP
ncbi:peptide chain release factor N(5)-glutamine methyltransferase [Williamsia sp. 1135]|uniref:peptide chain release factor N(5)-glutamine methyltransferase n=1 Tax=Williamsia sp. 1135 TaxID=1889262 RepID=UPI000A109D65|nr:peptide chain release factor N(5)-glutamine methyltransferase [Williamsia sp. 1135]ORM26065.1 protein-(glutamine-N5) methyltransferase, release factor-specific [Williamsia sp. 1135]